MIVISPAKNMNLENPSSHNLELNFPNQSLDIVKQIQSLSIKQLSELLKIKDKVLDTTYDYYHNFPLLTKPAIKLYDGVCFKQIKHDNKEYIKNNVYIFSALYGIVNGYDYIAPYRLDFMYKNIIDIACFKTFKPLVNQYINDLAPDYILDLASSEFSKLLDQKILSMPIYHLEIIGTSKPSSVLLKKIRGSIVDYSIKNQITNIDDYNQLNNEFIEDSYIDQDNKLLCIKIKDS